MDMQEIKDALAVKHTEIDAQIKKINDITDTKSAEYKAALDTVNEKIKSLDGQILDLAQKHSTTVDVIESKTFGQQVVESDGIKSFINGTATRGRVEIKNTILTADAAAHTDQLDSVMGAAFQPLTVMPTVAQGQTSEASVTYPKESNWVNGAAAQVEGDTKAESTLTLESVSNPVVTVAHFLKVSKQAISDSSFLSSFIERRMRHGVNIEMEKQVISGDGVGANMSGWLATGNNTVISPLLTVDFFGLANKLKMAVIANNYTPSYYYANPADWGAAETSRRASGDNAFVAASGAVAYVNNGLTPMLWGLPVVLSNSVPVGTLICKSFDADMLMNREGVLVEMFEQDGDNVQKNLVTIRGEARAVELVFSAGAICTGDITGITSPV